MVKSRGEIDIIVTGATVRAIHYSIGQVGIWAVMACGAGVDGLGIGHLGKVSQFRENTRVMDPVDHRA